MAPLSQRLAGLKAGSLYFLIVFAFGFVFGVIRTFWVVPRLGARSAEMLEMPLMVGISAIAARWLVRRLQLAPLSLRAGMGFVGFVLLVGAEFATAYTVRGQSPAQAILTREPVSGSLFLTAMVLFGLMPCFFRPHASLPKPETHP